MDTKLRSWETLGQSEVPEVKICDWHLKAGVGDGREGRPGDPALNLWDLKLSPCSVRLKLEDTQLVSTAELTASGGEKSSHMLGSPKASVLTIVLVTCID